MNRLADLFCCLQVSATPNEVREKPLVKQQSERDVTLIKLFFDTLCRSSESGVVSSLLELKELIATASRTHSQLNAHVRQIEQLSLFSSRKIFVSNWLAWAILTEASFVETNAFLQRGLAFLLENGAFQQDWLGQLLPKNTPNGVVDRIHQAMQGSSYADKVEVLYQRMLVDKNIDRLTLTKAELLAISIFAIIGLGAGKCERGKYYKKERFGLARTIQWDYQKQVFYILSKSHAKGTVVVDSSFKRVAEAVRVGLAKKWPIVAVAQSVNRCGDDINPLEQEVALHQRLYGSQSEGIWPIWHVCSYKKIAVTEGASNVISKLSFIAPLADGTLYALFRKTSLKTVLEAIRQICAGLHSLHEQHLIHGDLKPENVLFKKYPDRLVVGLIDFGFVTNVEARPTVEMLCGRFNEGYYGSLLPTPPEMLANSDFEGDYIKAEMWALGHMLYCCYMRKGIFWDDSVDKLAGMSVVTKRHALLKQAILSAMMRSVVEAKKDITEGGPHKYQLDPQLRLELLIMNLLSFDPLARPTSQEAMEEVVQIQALL